MATKWLTFCFAYLTPFLATIVSAQLNNESVPISTFKSRPDIFAPFLNMTIYDEFLVSPGYIFLAPYQTIQDSIYMYDNRGNLVWSGAGPTGAGPSHNFHVCPINGTDMMCFFTGYQDVGYGRGHYVIMNNELRTATTVQSQGGLAPGDIHEFNVVDGGKSALISLYQPTQQDLSSVGITSGLGWLLNCYFQEIDIGTGELLFEWDALSHVPLDEGWVLPNTTDVSGTGLGSLSPPSSPWDYFHINSIDKFANGDYLISGRHTSTIYRISGENGSIIWRCGGSNSDFVFETGFNYSFQHDARIRSDNANTTIISFFDNASNGYNQSASHSSGMVFQIDHVAKHASLVQKFNPPSAHISASQGNTQVLDKSDWENSNVFISWGSEAYISEHTPDGTMIQEAHFATTGTMGYRGFKYNYTTNPIDAPAAFVYAHNTSASTVCYMSWNGATEAAQWRIYSSDSATGPWTVVDTVPKDGFETTFVAPMYYEYTMVESLDGSGAALKNLTRSIKTFVPGRTLATACDMYSCPVAQSYSGSGTENGSGSSASGTASGSSATETSASVRKTAQGKEDGRVLWLVFLVALAFW